MPWFKVDDDFHDHPKARKAGPMAVGVWTLCGGWSADNLTDGYVPAQVAKEKGGHNWRRAAERLVAVGLWYAVDGPPESLMQRRDEDAAEIWERRGRDARETLSHRDWGVGYQFHDWHRYQPTRDDWVSKREADAARQRASRARRKAARHGVTPTNGRSINGNTRDRRGEAVSHHPDPYVPTVRLGERAEDVNGPAVGHDPNSSPSMKPTPNGTRSKETEAALAKLRAQLPKGRPLRNTPPPVDPHPRGGA